MTATPTAPDTSQRGDLDLLRDFLATHDASCPSCRHNLHGAAGPACPECGVGLDLKLTLAGRPHAAWALSLVAAAMTLGFSGPFALAGAYAHWIGGLQGRESFSAWLAMFAAICSLAAMTIVLCRRAEITRTPLSRQWPRALLLALVLVGLHAVLFMIFADVGIGYLYPD